MCSRRCGSIGQAAKRPVDCRGIVSGSLLALTSIAEKWQPAQRHARYAQQSNRFQLRLFLRSCVSSSLHSHPILSEYQPSFLRVLPASRGAQPPSHT